MADDRSVAELVQARLASDKLTPMMRQYLSAKAGHPEAIILFRMGDFFETFYEDAEDCARILGITLTARTKERDVPMAGVPHHAIDGYLARLMAQGRSVVLVDQVEDPKTAKGLVKREITRILTPGTYVDPQAPARRETHLVGVVSGGTRRAPRWGICDLELSTGSFRATAVTNTESLAEELDRIAPAEILVVEGRPLPVTPSAAVNERSLAEAVEARPMLVRHFGSDETRGLETLLGAEVLEAAGLVMGFVAQTQLLPDARDVQGRATLGHITELTPYEPGAGLILDAQARTHLELFRAQGDGVAFFDCVDRTVTPPGGRLLAEWIALPLSDLDAIRDRSEAVAHLCATTSVLDAVRLQLEDVGDLHRLVGRLALGRASPRDLVAMAAAVEAATPLFERIATSETALSGVEASDLGRLTALIGVDPCPDTASIVRGALQDSPPVDVTQPGVFTADHDDELARLARLSRDGKQLIADLEAKERASTGIASLKVRYNKVFGYFIEVTKANLALVPDRYVRKQTMVNAERFFTPELKELEEQVLTADERRQARAQVLYAQLVEELQSRVARLRRLASALAEIDVLAALAALALDRDWVRPVVHAGTDIVVEEGRHPVLEALEDRLGERFIPNDVELNDEERLVVITGPNMAGKSTIMRQVALIVILAHIGAFVPARAARIGRVDRVFTRVGAGDELSRGRSTFMVEMTETARILRSATARSLVLLDEIGRGTSTFDGLSIAWAVAEYLHDVVEAKTLFATHYHELVELTKTRARATNRHVAVKELGDRIVFLRKLETGGSNRSYGVQVAKLAGLPEPVVNRAREVLAGLEAQRSSLGDADQLELFIASRSTSGPPGPRPVQGRQGPIDGDGITPRQAMGDFEGQQAILRSR